MNVASETAAIGACFRPNTVVAQAAQQPSLKRHPPPGLSQGQKAATKLPCLAALLVICLHHGRDAISGIRLLVGYLARGRTVAKEQTKLSAVVVAIYQHPLAVAVELEVLTVC